MGVYSTALFEGLTFSLRTFLLDHPGVERMEQLVERGTADVVGDAAELAGLLEDDPGRADVDPEAFFRPNSWSKWSESSRDCWTMCGGEVRERFYTYRANQG